MDDLEYRDILCKNFNTKSPHKEEIISSLLELNSKGFSETFLIVLTYGTNKSCGWFSADKKGKDVLKELGAKLPEPFKVPEISTVRLSSFHDVKFSSQNGFKGSFIFNQTLKEQFITDQNHDPTNNIYYIQIIDKK